MRWRWLALPLGAALVAMIPVAEHTYAIRKAALAGPPCGGEALSQDTFPPIAKANPSEPDTRSQNFIPDPASVDAVLTRTGARQLMAQVTTRFAHASPSQAANIALVAKKLNGMVIAPGQIFSYLQATGPYTRAGGYGWGRMFVGTRIVPTIGGGVCQGASTLYNVVLLSNLKVIERHLHGLTVPYLPPATDATVSDDADLDFRFQNTSGGPIVLWAQAKDRNLTIAAYGMKAPPRVTIHSEVLSRTPFGTVYVNDPDLPRGTEETAAPGQEGLTARAWVTIEQGGQTTTRNLGTHTYRPSPKVILRGTGPAPSSSSSASSA